MELRWNNWNIDHIGKHGVSTREAEMAVRNARAPFPRKIEDDRWLVWGRGEGGRFLQVVFVLDPEEMIFVIHARPLNEQEKRRLRRRDKR